MGDDCSINEQSVRVNVMQDKTLLLNEDGENFLLNEDAFNEKFKNLKFNNYYDYKVGDKIGNCSLIEKIGAGGGSNIYLAYHNNLGRQVVLKEYKYIQSKIELDLLLNLKHPHIPSVYDYIKENGKEYLVMEYIDGLDLRRILHDGALDEDRVLKYAVQLCDTVEYLHSQNPQIMHGDIKPANIIINKKDEVVLIDFNISLPVKIGMGVPIGYSNGYVAPEVMRAIFDKKAKYNPILADIYGIGVTLFEMVTGMSLNRALHDNNFIFNPDKYNEKLLLVIDRATEDKPEDRFRSAREMKDMLMSDKMYKYDIALSFAGEDRAYVDKVARYLTDKGIRVFYDTYEQVELWGKDLYIHLADVYQNKARYCIIFISKFYREKLWTTHEMRAAFTRAFTSSSEYILPARFDDTEITGINHTLGYIDLRVTSPKVLADYAIKKVKGN